MTSKRKIEFHGKEMNLLVAKLYLLGINYGIIQIDLDSKEKADYKNGKQREEEKGIFASRHLSQKSLEETKIRLNEKKYLSSILERKIREEERLRKEEYCKEYGHKKGNSSNNSLNTKESYCVCSRCGLIYEENSKITPINPFIPSDNE